MQRNSLWLPTDVFPIIEDLPSRTEGDQGQRSWDHKFLRHNRTDTVSGKFFVRNMALRTQNAKKLAAFPYFSGYFIPVPREIAPEVVIRFRSRALGLLSGRHQYHWSSDTKVVPHPVLKQAYSILGSLPKSKEASEKNDTNKRQWKW